MLRALLFLHCDGCHKMYEKLSTTSYRDPGDWPDEIEALAVQATKVGWYVPPSWQNLLCTACHEERMSVEF